MANEEGALENDNFCFGRGFMIEKYPNDARATPSRMAGSNDGIGGSVAYLRCRVFLCYDDFRPSV